MARTSINEIRLAYEAGELLTEEEKLRVKPYSDSWKVKVNEGGSKAPLIVTDTLTAINQLLNTFKFNIKREANQFFIEDCRKTPPKRINERNPYKTETEAINRMAGRILSEFEERSYLYKIAAVKYPNINELLTANKKYRKPS